jgi:methyl-accepting chemotaxis protein
MARPAASEADGAAATGSEAPERQVAALGGPSPATLAAETAPFGVPPAAVAPRGEQAAGVAQAGQWFDGEPAAAALATLRAVATRLLEGAFTEDEDDERSGGGGPVLLTLALGLLAVVGGSAVALLGQAPAWRPAADAGTAARPASPGARRRIDDGGARHFTEADLVAAAALLREQAPLRRKRRLPSTPLFSAAAELARARRSAGFGRLAERIELPLAVTPVAARAGGSTTGAPGASPAACQLGRVASAAEELAASVAAISRQVAESTRIAGEAVAEAERTGISMQALADTAERIGEAVRLIRQVDHQANALALNATLKAARGGDVVPVARVMQGLAAQAGWATAAAGAEAGRLAGGVTAMEEVIGRLSHIAAGVDAAVERQRTATLQMVCAIRHASPVGSASPAAVEVREDAAVLDAAARVEAATRELCRYVETTRSQIEDAEAAMQAA